MALDLTNPDVRPSVEGYDDALWWWCGQCSKWYWSGPAHEGSRFCKSGKRPHCTCSSCF